VRPYRFCVRLFSAALAAGTLLATARPAGAASVGALPDAGLSDNALIIGGAALLGIAVVVAFVFRGR
jgi:hypothetical protein